MTNQRCHLENQKKYKIIIENTILIISFKKKISAFSKLT